MASYCVNRCSISSTYYSTNSHLGFSSKRHISVLPWIFMADSLLTLVHKLLKTFFKTPRMVDCNGSSKILIFFFVKSQNITSGWPFLCLDEKKKLTLFSLLFLHQGGADPANSVLWKGVPRAASKTEFSLKRWVHVGCEVSQDFVRLHIDGEIVEEKSLPCTINKDLLADALRGIYLTCPNGNEDTFNGYVYGMDVSFPASAIKEHFLKDCPLQLSIDHSIPPEVEEDSDGVWSIIGGKTSCRRIVSLDIVLLDTFGCSVNKELEVVASLLYADNGAPVDNTNHGEPPLLISYDGIEFASLDRPCKLINERASFKLKISQGGRHSRW